MIFHFLVLISLFTTLNARAIHRGQPVPDSAKPEVWRLYAVPQGTMINHLKDLVDHASEWCTAVAISSSRAVTAGHCVFNGETQSYYDIWLLQLGTQQILVKAKKADLGEYKGNLDTPSSYDPNTRYHPDYIAGCRPSPVPLIQSRAADLAVLDFNNNTFSTWSPVNLNYKPQVGDVIEYWGHGEKNNSLVALTKLRASVDEMTLSQGESNIESFHSQRLGFSNKLMANWADIGDSGGPVYHNGQLVAVLSTMEEKCESETGHDYKILNSATWVKLILDF